MLSPFYPDVTPLFRASVVLLDGLQLKGMENRKVIELTANRTPVPRFAASSLTIVLIGSFVTCFAYRNELATLYSLLFLLLMCHLLGNFLFGEASACQQNGPRFVTVL
jgi:hypothetical protein